jgi:NADH:ubiquinone oxidoreductase subunit C
MNSKEKELLFKLSPYTHISNIELNKINNFLIIINSKNINIFLQFIYNNSILIFKQCVDIVAYDNISYGNLKRYCIIYILRSLTYNSIIYVNVQINDLQGLFSIINLYRSSKWSEREVSELFGIFIFNNTDLRRLIIDYGFKGHPLRKDFPLTGYIELIYDTLITQLIYTKVELTQEYRNIYI